jgi:hypothetical protein
MATAAIQAERESAKRARKIYLLMWLPPVLASMPGTAGRPKFTNSRTPPGLISGKSRPL